MPYVTRSKTGSLPPPPKEPLSPPTISQENDVSHQVGLVKTSAAGQILANDELRVKETSQKSNEADILMNESLKIAAANQVIESVADENFQAVVTPDEHMNGTEVPLVTKKVHPSAGQHGSDKSIDVGCNKETEETNAEKESKAETTSEAPEEMVQQDSTFEEELVGNNYQEDPDRDESLKERARDEHQPNSTSKELKEEKDINGNSADVDDSGNNDEALRASLFKKLGHLGFWIWISALAAGLVAVILSAKWFKAF